MTKMMFQEETDFKDSPIGKVPKEWEVAKLETLAQIHDSKRVPLSKMQRKNRKGPYPYCGANGIIDYIDDFIFDGEYVLLAEDGGSYGKLENSAYVMSGKFWVNNHAHILKAIEGKATNQFLKTTLDFLDLNSYIVGSTRKKLNQERMREIKIQAPAIPEQRAIVGVLGVVDSALDLADQVIAKTERLKKGLMQQLLTHGIGHAEYKSTPIGIMPKEWHAVQLKDVVRSYKNGIYKPSQYAGKGRPCVRMYNIVAGQINLVNAALLDVTNQELEEFGLEQGDIVVNRVNTSELVGKAGVVPASFGKATFESKNIRVRLDTKQILPEFLSVFVQTKAYSNQLLSKAKTAVAQATITQVDLDAIIIPLPPTIDEQQEVVQIISTIDKKLQLEKEERLKVDKIKRGLMDLLLTGKVRIKVD